MNKTLKTLEGYVPRFFTGASKLFDENISNSNLTHTNQNPNKKFQKDLNNKSPHEAIDFIQNSS